MDTVKFVLNIPWILIGLFCAFVSIPVTAKVQRKPPAIIVYVRKLWWAIWYMKGARAVTIGHVVLMTNQADRLDLKHELIHVEQNQRNAPIQPFLYSFELLRKGYRNNKYEDEAYRISGSRYTG